jgi:threonylcarbamoyladenosine tRNA methylthiotransferase MtaB
MKTRVAFHTAGCRTNQSETASLKQALLQSGFELVRYPDESADVLVVHSCTVTHRADADLRRLIRRVGRRSPETRIAVIGCYAEKNRRTLEKFPNVKWVAGNAEKWDLPGMLASAAAPGTGTAASGAFTVPFPADDPEQTRGYLKIQDGCDSYCAYCIVPFTRGAPRSRRFEDLTAGAKRLLDRGYREIVLTGINIGRYEDSNRNLLDVLEALAAFPGDFRVRLSSVEPVPLLEDVAAMMEKHPRICRFLHVPLQSASPEILKRMGRGTDLERVKHLLVETRRRIPGICLGTDLLAGFPGETETHFRETLDFVHAVPFCRFHVFPYSRRPGTRSARFSEFPASAVVAKRTRRLRELGDSRYRRHLESLGGTVQKVLFEQKKNGRWTGLTDHYARVSVTSDEDLRNRFRRVRIGTLRGETVEGTLA